MIDFIPLVAAQTGMVLTIARIYQYKITTKRARELIGTFGLGMLGRVLFQQLSKFAAVPGWILSSAIATSMTIAMGYAAIEWFEKGERISNEKFRQLSRELSQSLVLRLREIFKRKPSKKQLKRLWLISLARKKPQPILTQKLKIKSSRLPDPRSQRYPKHALTEGGCGLPCSWCATTADQAWWQGRSRGSQKRLDQTDPATF